MIRMASDGNEEYRKPLGECSLAEYLERKIPHVLAERIRKEDEELENWLLNGGKRPECFGGRLVGDGCSRPMGIMTARTEA